MKTARFAIALAALTVPTATAFGAPVYTQSFDSDDSANWKVNNNNNGDNRANIFFDYSTVGIPSAPHSTGGTTRGIKLGANVSGTGPTSPALSGISVSPIGQSFTGDYSVRFDWWHNFLGNASGGIGNSAGGSGSTQLSTFGVLSAGTTPSYVGATDGVFFGATGDGAAAADFRAYSSEKQAGYGTTTTGTDLHATYAGNAQNNTSFPYNLVFKAGATAPTAQTTLSSTQSGSTLAGMAGFRWHDVEITKVGNLVTWNVDGAQFATVDTTNFATATAGTNILFGMADTSSAAGTPANLFEQLDFTLIDNVNVTSIPGPSALGLLGVGAVGLLRRRRAAR